MYIIMYDMQLACCICEYAIMIYMLMYNSNMGSSTFESTYTCKYFSSTLLLVISTSTTAMLYLSTTSVHVKVQSTKFHNIPI